MSATAWSATDGRPVTAGAAFRSPRAVTALSAWAVCRSSARFAGTAPILPCARRTPRTRAQLTWFAREIDTSRCEKRVARRRDGGVGSGSVRLSQMTGAAPGLSAASWAAVAVRACRRADGFFVRGTFSTYGEFACVRVAARCGFAAGCGDGVTGEGVAAGATAPEPPPSDESEADGADGCAGAAGEEPGPGAGGASGDAGGAGDDES